MLAHRMETTLKQDGTITLSGLPFHTGEVVEIIILAQPAHTLPSVRYPLRNIPTHYDRPTEAVDIPREV
ncbi:MAG: hypothetical protein H0X37_08375 [Herpetosiphonaceae bacterium]|nr:hypothetical protein [Herpetosiphonaceae bacterium]